MEKLDVNLKMLRIKWKLKQIHIPETVGYNHEGNWSAIFDTNYNKNHENNSIQTVSKNKILKNKFN